MRTERDSGMSINDYMDMGIEIDCADYHGYHGSSMSDWASVRNGFHCGLMNDWSSGSRTSLDNPYGISAITRFGVGHVDGRRWREAYICGNPLPQGVERCEWIQIFIEDYHHTCDDVCLQPCFFDSRRTAWAGMSGYGGNVREAGDFEVTISERVAYD